MDPDDAELDVKLAFARQAGDEAGHFQLVADRLAALGFDVDGVRSRRPTTRCSQYLAALAATVERIAAGLFTLESIAYGVNENFMAFCAQRGDHETVRIYREYIQPDERAHQQLGQRAAREVRDDAGACSARDARPSRKVLEIAQRAARRPPRQARHRLLPRLLAARRMARDEAAGRRGLEVARRRRRSRACRAPARC